MTFFYFNKGYVLYLSFLANTRPSTVNRLKLDETKIRIKDGNAKSKASGKKDYRKQTKGRTDVFKKLRRIKNMYFMN